jgi:hypothetical protein
MKTQLNKISIKKLKSILTGLFSEYNYIRISTSGMITLKSNWWSFHKRKVHYCELLISKEIPKKLKYYRLKNDDYESVYNTQLYIILTYNDQLDIIDYVYKEFVKIKFPIYLNNTTTLLTEPSIKINDVIQVKALPEAYACVIRKSLIESIKELNKQ